MMPRVSIEKTLSIDKKIELLGLLEKIGKTHAIMDIENSLLNFLPEEDRKNKELVARIFLLAAILDQQADSESARNTVKKIYEQYGKEFFLYPENFLKRIREITNSALETYIPKTRVIRMKKNAVTLLRIGGYMLFLTSIKSTLLEFLIENSKEPKDILQKILNDNILSGLLYEKAARLFTAWITYPSEKLIDISKGKWKPHQIPMIINGHVTKVLVRAGFLNFTYIESGKNIVEASKMRPYIERMINEIAPYSDKFMIDYGAFYIGINYCREEDPICENCPLNKLCKKNIEFRAY